jgi:hypothetical protein
VPWPLTGGALPSAGGAGPGWLPAHGSTTIVAVAVGIGELLCDPENRVTVRLHAGAEVGEPGLREASRIAASIIAGRADASSTAGTPGALAPTSRAPRESAHHQHAALLTG